MASTYHPRVYAYHKRTINGMDYMRAGRYSGDGAKHCWNLVRRGKFEQRDGQERMMTTPSAVTWGHGGPRYTTIGFDSFVYSVKKGEEADIVHTPLWTPAQMGGLLVWLDAEDEDSFELVGDRVQMWKDKGPLGHDAFAPTTTQRPTLLTDSILGNGRSVLFGTSRWMNVGALNALDNAQPYTIVLILNVIQTGAVQSLFSRSNHVELRILSTADTIRWAANFSDYYIDAAITTGPNYVLAEGNSENSLLSVNRVDTTGDIRWADWSSFDGYTRIGNTGRTDTSPNRHYTGEMAEVMFFDRLLSVSDLAYLNVYINRKYSL